MFILSGDKWTSILPPKANRIETQKTTKFYEYCAVFLILSAFYVFSFTAAAPEIENSLDLMVLLERKVSWNNNWKNFFSVF